MAQKMSPEQAMAQMTALFSQVAQAGAPGATSDYQSLNSLFQGGGVSPLRSRPTGVVGVGIANAENAISQGFAPFANYLTAPTGALKYTDTGVIADPTSNNVLFPEGANTEDIEGSPEWLRKIQEKWDDAKFDKWRKQLIKLGFHTVVEGGIAESGGLAGDVIQGLAAYHKFRYLNGGKVIPLVPGGGKQNIREAVREQVDVVSLREEVKAWGEIPFGESLDPGTADYFTDRMLQKMTELARKHPSWTMKEIETGATMRVQKEFIKEPGVRESIDDAADEEMSTKLRDSIISVSQLGSI